MEDRANIGAGPGHWNAVHVRRPPEQLTWYQREPRLSLDFIKRAGVDRSAPLIDVGGGSSRLCDELIGSGFTDVTVVDISPAALAHVETRVGDRGERLQLVEADVGEYRSGKRFDLWHDRAVFHFLLDESEVDSYIDSLTANLAAHGHVVMATFGLDGPEVCSGLPVRRYGADSLAATLGGRFEPVAFEEELHNTPRGGTQHFLYGLFRGTS
ncbi:MAG: class I SAM-dependent methyltransferase [Acidimicrobiia bacterium]|nr:class I SAM-dependent methyltransferase [Acidimicrobiia bacterium]